MKRRLSDRGMASKAMAILLLLVLSPLVLFAQDGSSAAKPASADQFAGNYKGSAKSPDGDIALTLDIKFAQGKITGRLVTPQGEQPFTSGEVVDGKLTLKLGSGLGSGVLALQLRDDKVVGEWKAGAVGRAVEFKKVPVTTGPSTEVKKPSTEPSDAELLSGEWDAAADAQGQPFPFTLTLKVEGEKVTGGSSSSLGN